MLFVRCGIFQPRDVFEDPVVNSSYDDPLHFSAIYESIGELVTWRNYDELFSDTLYYYDVISSIQISGKEIMVRHLKNISVYSVNWTVESGSVSKGADYYYIPGVRYSISDSSGTVSYSGLSNIRLVNDGRFKIVSWTDIPDGDQKSFFAPDWGM